MKNSFFSFFALLLFSGILMTSCQKENTPSFKTQLEGHWQSSSVMVNSTDLSSFNQYKLFLEGTHEFELEYTTGLGSSTSTTLTSGDWQEDQEKQDVTLIFNETGEALTYEVRTITSTEMVVEFIENNNRVTVSFEKIQE
ncbi:MAG: hypothetical protein R2792_04280 [Saprospiraceae bacterium]|jgi:hypothetical protein